MPYLQYSRATQGICRNHPEKKERQPVKRCAVPGLSPDKPHAEAKKNRPDMPSPYRYPSEKIDEQEDNCVAGSSTAHPGG
ncbi:hypothetical protein MRX96_010625 [Rhipicephalus microplus]